MNNFQVYIKKKIGGYILYLYICNYCIILPTKYLVLLHFVSMISIILQDNFFKSIV